MSATIAIIETTPAQKLKVAISFSLVLVFEYLIYCFSNDEPPVPLTGQPLLDFVQSYGNVYEDEYRTIIPQITNTRDGNTDITIVQPGTDVGQHKVKILIPADYTFEETLFSELEGEELGTFLQNYANEFETVFRTNNAAIILPD